MKFGVLTAIAFVLIIGGMLCISGLLQQEFPAVATWFSKPGIVDQIGHAGRVVASAVAPKRAAAPATPSMTPAAAGAADEEWLALWDGLRARWDAWLAPQGLAASSLPPEGQTLAAASSPTGAAALELNGISWSGTAQHSVAVVNHRSLTIGESIDGYTLQHIAPTAVELVGRGERVRLGSNGTREITPLAQVIVP